MIEVGAPLAVFAFVMSITPGPNNFMLLAAGARFGLRRSWPHMLGITGGFLGLLLVAQLGVAAVVLARPGLTTALNIGCAVYLCYLGWGLLQSASGPAPRSAADLDAQDSTPASAQRPLLGLEAAAFQFANPKAWGMAIGAVSIVAEGKVGPVASVAVLLGVCGAINLPCILVWTLFGAALRRWLGTPWIRLAFHSVMAALLVATALWMTRPVWP